MSAVCLAIEVQHVVLKLVLKSEDRGWSRITCVIHMSFTEHIRINTSNFNLSSTS